MNYNIFILSSNFTYILLIACILIICGNMYYIFNIYNDKTVMGLTISGYLILIILYIYYLYLYFSDKIPNNNEQIYLKIN